MGSDVEELSEVRCKDLRIVHRLYPKRNKSVARVFVRETDNLQKELYNGLRKLSNGCAEADNVALCDLAQLRNERKQSGAANGVLQNLNHGRIERFDALGFAEVDDLRYVQEGSSKSMQYQVVRAKVVILRTSF